MSSSMPEPGHPKQFNPIPDGYEYSYLPHTFGGPWSQPLSCTRCGAIVIGKSVRLHDEFHISQGRDMTITSGPSLDPDEQAAMDALLACYKRICAWGLRANSNELASAVHVIQGFIIQHMLSRVDPDHWSDWYGRET